MEDYLENCANVIVDIEALERFMEPENEEVSLRYILKYSTRDIFQLLDIAEKKDHVVASRNRWLESATKQESSQNEWHDMKYQGEMANAPPCPERTLKTPMPQQSSPSSRNEESQWVAVEDRRRRLLRYPEDSEEQKVCVTELQEQLGMSEEAGISMKQVAQQARNDYGQKR